MVIYLDAAATMPVIDGVTTRIAENLESRWGSVSGAHQVSLSAKNLLEEARERIAESLDVAPDSIVFTSGATEALNLVIQGFGRAHPDARIFYSSIEHAAVKEAAEYRKSHGHNIETLSVDNSGQLLLDQLDDISEGDLVCVMPVNNEVGVVNDVEAIAEKVHERGGYLLLDCVQSFYAYEPATMCEIADFVVYSGHKLGAPQGVGMLVAKNRKLLDPLSFGGPQEWELRPGTTPAFLADVFAFVFTDALTRRSDDIAHITRCYDRSVERIAQSLPSARVHCEDARRSPHIIALDIAGIESQMVVAMLDARDMCISRGSACASGASTPSHVLLAMGIDEKDAMSTIRLSFHPGTTEDDIDTAIDELSKIVTSLAPRETAGVS